MSTALPLLDLKIASPCKMPWDAMKGDDHSRFCGQCEKSVYNIAAMTTAEVRELVKRTEGDFCGRLYKRRDGTVLTADCPVGKREAPRRLMRRVVAGAIIGAGMLTTGAVLRGSSRAAWEWPPTGPNVTTSDWWDWALTTVGIRSRPRFTAGAMMFSLDELPPPPTMGEMEAIPMPPKCDDAGSIESNP